MGETIVLEAQKGLWIEERFLRQAHLGERLEVLVAEGEIRILPAATELPRLPYGATPDEVQTVLREARAAAPRAKEHPLAGLRPADKTGWQKWFDEWFQQIGITAQPRGAEELQALMLQEGVRPEDNLLSQGIIAMREE